MELLPLAISIRVTLIDREWWIFREWAFLHQSWVFKLVRELTAGICTSEMLGRIFDTQVRIFRMKRFLYQ
eukprot:4286764-Pyramimonas_sp.AAC.1